MRNVVDCRHLLVILFAGALSFESLDSAYANDVPQSFTLDGQLFRDAAGTLPLVDSSIGFKIQILDQDQVCVLYEEQQTVNTASSQGYFSAQVGSAVGSPRRTVGDSANTMASVFQNINAVNGKLLSNGAACTAAALAGNRRFVRIVISPPSLGGAERVLSPNLTLDSVPNAVVAERAESIQGFRSSDLLKVNTASGAMLSQTNLESLFSSVSRFNSLSAVVDGTSSSYVQSSAGGARLPVLTGAPTGPTEGAIWYDTTDDRLKYYNGSAPITVGSGSGSVTSVGFTAPAELSVSGAPVTSSGTIAVTWASQTANRVLASPNGSAGAPSFRALVAADVPFAVQNSGGTPSLQSGLDAAKGAAGTAGRVWIATDTRFIYRDTGTVWETIGDGGGGGPTGTAGGDLDGTYPNPTVDGIQGVAISAVAPTDGQVLRYTTAGTNWAPANFSAADLRTPGGAAQFASATCAASQTTTWSSLTNTFTCIDIAGLAASTITTGTIDIARLPAAVQYWTAATGGINYAGGNVGIGTTTPAAHLDVFGPSGAAAFLKLSRNDGSALNIVSPAGSPNVATFGVVAPTANGGALTNALSIVSFSGGGYLAGNVGIGTVTPTAGLHIAQSGLASTPGQRLDGAWFSGGTATTTKPQLLIEPSGATSTAWSTSGTGLGVNAASGFTGNLIDLQMNGTSRFRVSAGGVISGDGSGLTGVSASALPLNSVTAASATNTINNLNFAQTWNWSTATTENPLSISANALTTGSLLNLTTSNASVNSTNGLLRVANTGASTSGMIARIQSNSTAASGLSVLANGNIGMGTTAPTHPLEVAGTAKATSGFLGWSGAANYSPLTSYLSTAPLDQKYWDFYQGGSDLSLRLIDDPHSTSNTVMRINRTGMSVNYISFPLGNVGIGTTAPTAGLSVLKNGAASAPAVRIDGSWFTGGTSTTTKPQFLVEATGANTTGVWNTDGTGIGVNAPSGFSWGGNLIDLKVNGDSYFSVRATGDTYARGINLNPGYFGAVTHGPGQNQAAINDEMGIWRVTGNDASWNTYTAGDIKFVATNVTAGTVSNSMSIRTVANGTLTDRISISGAGNVGIGTTAPNTVLDINGAFSQRGMAVPANSVAGQGRIYFDSTSNKFRVSENNGAYTDLVGAGGGSALSSLTAATATNTIDNLNFAQTWNWSTATTENPLSISANALTTGSLLNLTTSNASVNSTNGLLRVANTGASTSGVVARIQSNSTAGSGLTVLANGNVGVGTATPAARLAVRAPGGVGTDLFTVENTTGNTFMSIDQWGATYLDRLDIVNVDGGAAWAGQFTSTNTDAHGIFVQTAANDTTKYGVRVLGNAGARTDFVVRADGNVGIGTGSPGSKLSIVDTSGSAPIQLTTSGGLITDSLYFTANGRSRFGYDGVRQAVSISDVNAAGTTSNKHIVFDTNASERFRVTDTGNIGIGTTSPNTQLDITGAFSQRGMAVPANSVAGQGRIYFDSTSNKFRVSENNGAYTDLVGGGGSSSLSSLTAATATNTIDSLNFAQTWNWSTATTENPLSISANALTTGSLLNLTTSNASVNSTNGLLRVANTGASTSGVVARIQSNSTAGSGLTVLASGNVGVGTTAPLVRLDARGASAKATTAALSYISQAASTDATGPLAVRTGVRTHATAANRYGAIEVDDNGTKRTLALQPSGGSVGIGTTTPGQTLEVNTPSSWSYIRVTNNDTSGASGIIFGHSFSPTTDYAYVGSQGANNGAPWNVFDQTLTLQSAVDRIMFGSWTDIRMSIVGGNVGIGTTSPTSKLEVAGAVRATAGTITSALGTDTDLTIDFSQANVISTSASCGAVTLSNMQDGGSYTLIVTGSSAGICTFSHTGVTGFKFAPANATTDTASGGETVYTFLKAGSKLYISWVTGMR